MKRVFLVVALLAAAPACLTAGASASLKIEKITIPTYLIGSEDPNPPLWRSRVYPYPMQTDLTGVRRDSAYTAAILENRYIRAIILPEVGGRLYGAFDKTNGNWDFLYCNEVIKPGLVGLRGAWLSGGIEWNFPSLGHTVTTVSPVLWTTKRYRDGSVSVIIGDTEWVSRMRWSVEVRVYPDRSYLHVTTTLYNPTLTHNNGYYWANAAVHATDDVQVIFPPTNYVVTHGRRRVYQWPVHDGVDISWYRNIPHPGDFFCGLPGDFNGAYYHERDCGTVHIGDRYEVPGKKFWTWGTARSGAIWEDLLTDHSGQYIEIQAGRLPNQSDTWIFEPHTVERWEEYWYPVKGLRGGFVQATAEAALNVRWSGTPVDLAVNVTRPHNDLALVIRDRGEEVSRLWIGALDPSRAWSKSVELGVRPVRPEVLLVADGGDTLLRYVPVEIRSPVPPPARGPKPESEMTAEELALRGLELEKAWNPDEAERLYRKALAADSGQTLALVRLGLMLYKSGRSDSAVGLFNRALGRNPDGLDARYYRALARMDLGDTAGAVSDLWAVSRRRAYSHVAPFVLAGIECARGNWNRAEELLRRGLRSNPDDFRAWGLLAAVLRRAGKVREARRVVEALLRDEPLNAFARCEKYFLTRAPEAKNQLTELLYLAPGVYYRGAEDYLELAWQYVSAGLLDEAAEVLEVYLNEAASRGRSPYPIVVYSLAWLTERNGLRARADSLFRLAAELPPDYVFPHRRETERVLRAAIARNPADWKAHYYLGNLLCGRRPWREGYHQYLAAVKRGGTLSVLFRNLGQIEWVKRRNYRPAVHWYEQAVAANPDDWHLYVDLDRLYSILGEHEKRCRLFAQAPEAVLQNFNVKLREALLSVDTGDYDRALAILTSNVFKPWEGWTGAREVFLLAHFRRGLERLDRGEALAAVADFRATMLYPENLGTGRPANPKFARSYYLLGRAFRGAGRPDSARHYFRLAAEESVGPASELGVYRALAMRELGQRERADSLLRRGLAQIDRAWAVPERRSYRLAYVRGLLLQALGDRERAAEAFELARRMNPEFRWAWWRL